MSSNLINRIMAIWIGTVMLFLQACGQTIGQPSSIIPSSSPFPPALDSSTPVSPINTPGFVEPTVCGEATIPPRIVDVQPSPIRPGSQITITGTGGYIQDSCGGYNESARTFNLFLDNELVSDLLCYVNQCKLTIYLADMITTGSHCLSTQKDICEYKFQVTK